MKMLQAQRWISGILTLQIKVPLDWTWLDWKLTPEHLAARPALPGGQARLNANRSLRFTIENQSVTDEQAITKTHGCRKQERFYTCILTGSSRLPTLISRAIWSPSWYPSCVSPGQNELARWSAASWSVPHLLARAWHSVPGGEAHSADFPSLHRLSLCAPRERFQVQEPPQVEPCNLEPIELVAPLECWRWAGWFPGIWQLPPKRKNSSKLTGNTFPMCPNSRRACLDKRWSKIPRYYNELSNCSKATKSSGSLILPVTNLSLAAAPSCKPSAQVTTSRVSCEGKNEGCVCRLEKHMQMFQAVNSPDVNSCSCTFRFDEKSLEEQSITPHQFPRIKLLLLTFPCVPLRWILGTCKKQRRVETPAEVKHFQESLQPNHFNWAEKKLDRCKSDAVSQHELKGVEMRRKRWKESRRTVPKSDTRAQKFRTDDGGLPQLLLSKLFFGSYSATFRKPGNFYL